MKRGYKRLLIFQILMTLVLVINSFVSSILTEYGMTIFLIISIILFKFFFGFEKDRHRYIKDILFEEALFLLIFFFLYYLSGLVFTFAKTGNYYTLRNMYVFILPLVSTIITKEFLRYNMLQKSEGSKLLLVTTILLFIYIDITTTIYYNDFASNYETFIFIALTLIPAISTNIACTYITKKVGYKPVMFYLLIIKLYQYLLPIIPNPNEYIVSVVNLLVPALLCYKIYLFYEKDQDEEVRRDYRKKHFGGLIIPGLIIIFLVYITSGYFHYYAVAIASGSMSPEIEKGDVVVIEKIEDNYKNLKIGQVIAYKYNNIIVVHRLAEKLKYKDEIIYYTKGDANADIDGYKVTEDMIIGTVNMKVPYIGLPTVWLNEL